MKKLGSLCRKCRYRLRTCPICTHLVCNCLGNLAVGLPSHPSLKLHYYPEGLSPTPI